MFKKIILIWMLIFASLFSSGDDFITTLPRKEKAYLDIEVTKVKTEIIDITEIDQINKRITLRDITLSSSDHLLLTENPDVFGALFSVNGRISALKSIAKETNLSYTINEGTGNEIFIDYNNLPSKIYAGVWSKSTKNLEKLYSLNLHVPTIYKSLNIELYPSISLSSLEPEKDLEITIGKFLTNDGGTHTTISIVKSNIITLKTPKGTEIGGTLKFKNLNENINGATGTANLHKWHGTEIILSLTSNELKKIQADGAPFKISFEKDGTHIIALYKGQNAAERDLVFEDFDIYFKEFFDIYYLPPSSQIYLNGSFNTNQDVYAEIGYVDIKNALNKYEMHFSPSNVRMDVNGREITQQAAKLLRDSSGIINDRFIVNSGQSGRADILLKIPYSAIKAAIEANSSIFTMNTVTLHNTPGSPSWHTLGPYEIIVSNTGKPQSSLILKGKDIQSDGTLLINHGSLSKDTSSDSIVSTALTLERVDPAEYLTLDQSKISIYLDNDGFIDLKNGQKHLEAFLKTSDLNLNSDKKSAAFNVISRIRAADINVADPGDYSGTTTLNIIINN